MSARIISLHAIPWILVAIHSMAVLSMAAFVVIKGGEAVMLWNMFVAIDFPIILIAWLSFLLDFTNCGDFVSDILHPAITFLVFGGVQYYYFGKVIVNGVLRRRKQYIT